MTTYREPKTHHLKIWPIFFRAVLDGSKTFELRDDDRNYLVGDTLLLEEWSVETGYTERVCKRVVTYTLKNEAYLQSGIVALGLRENRGRESQGPNVHTPAESVALSIPYVATPNFTCGTESKP